MLTQIDHEEIERGRRTYGASLTVLRGHGSLWHRTSVDALRAILGAGCIIPNEGKFPYTYPQSHLCYGNATGSVCLFDFDSASEDEILSQSYKWGPFLTDRGVATILIELPRSRLDANNLSFSNNFRGGNIPYLPVPAGEEHKFFGADKYVPTFFPYVEAWHRGEIATKYFARVIVFGEPENTIESRNVDANNEVMTQIARIADAWAERRSNYYKARSTAGQINLAEVLVEANRRARERENGKG